MGSLDQIEEALVEGLSPSFLVVTSEEDYIQIVVSEPSFHSMPMSQRVKKVYAVIKAKNKNILKTNVVIAQTFSEKEIRDILQYWLN